MTDRLPVPLEGSSVPMGAERASATPARSASRRDLAQTRREGRQGTPPRTLLDVQAWMIRAISGSDADAEGADDLVTRGHSLSARERLEIYRDGYRARLVECLADDYPVLAQTLGKDGFEALSLRYVERYPSSSPSLNAFGRHIPAFVLDAESERSLASFAPSRRFQSDLAALEWSLVEMVHAEIPPPLDVGALQALPADAWGTAWFEPSPASRLLRFAYPVNAYFQKCRMEDEQPPIPNPEDSRTVVYRQGLTVWRMDLTPAMARVLEALLAGVPIGEALGRLGVDESDPERIAEAERSVMVWFREWVRCGLFARLRTA